MAPSVESERTYFGASLESVASAPIWDEPRFVAVLSLLTRSGEISQLPARFSPEYISSPTLFDKMTALASVTDCTGFETSCAVQLNAFSGFRFGMESVGTRDSCNPPVTSETIGVIHTHPRSLVATGFSLPDYLEFLTRPTLRFFSLAYVDGGILVLKTNITPQNLSSRRVAHRLEDIYSDSSRASPTRALVRFNQLVCTEFGLVLFLKEASGFRRATVVSSV